MEDIENVVPEKLVNFVIDFVKGPFQSEQEYKQRYNTCRKKHKLCPSKPNIRKTYNSLVLSGDVSPNPSFLNYSLKKRVRSASGVSVITILTSPNPEYTDVNGNRVKQSFSCGQSCAYCPNEPEIHINLRVEEVFSDKKRIVVSTKDDIRIIRVITYVINNDKKYDVNDCFNFTDTSFMIEFSNEIEFNDFRFNDNITGIKGEQPRSYLSTEPAVLRANRDKFDPVLQIYDRADALTNCGHEVDKIEILVLGGTWDHYPIGYQKEFIRDIYYSINTLTKRNVDARLSLEQEIEISQTTKKRIIGLTLETRPDCVTLKQIKRMREFNVTRLQIGVQHIDDDILNYIERGCNTKDTITANYLWKNNGGKVDWHLMPDLPGSSIEKDMDMFQKIFGVNSITEVSENHFKYDLTYPELQADQLKIYPCSVVDWTKIKEWYDQGIYKPYAENEDDLIKVIIYIKKNVFPWIRINRIIRDIPNINILGGNKNVNLHQQIIDSEKVKSKCIRSREVKNNTKDIEKAKLFVREYNAVDAVEYFISFESPDQEILYGFLRLRINFSNQYLIYPELEDCGFIRELHVYGSIVKHDTKEGNSVQHQGFGKRLMKKAEELTYYNNYNKVAVIAGVGVREYYENIGYKLEKNYMIKTIYKESYFDPFLITVSIAIIIIIISIVYDIYS